MTSVDSGVETGNDSNDSSIVQHESQPATATAITTVANVQVAVNNVASLTVEDVPEFIDDTHPESDLVMLNLKRSGTLDSYVDYYKQRSLDSASHDADGKLLHLDQLVNLVNMKFPTYQIPYEKPIENRIIKSRTYNHHALGLLASRVAQRRFRQHKTLEWMGLRMKHAERRMRLAAATNNIDMVRTLLMRDVSPNNHDREGRTPLHHAACRGYSEMVNLLLTHGANPNQRDLIGNTPLHLAAVTSKISVVTLLLAHGTDVLSSDQHGYNPLQLAQAKLKMLQNYKCDDQMMNIKDEMRNIVKMLLAYLRKQKNMSEQMEALSNFCSRLSLSNTSDQVQDDVKDLLANIETLNIKS